MGALHESAVERALAALDLETKVRLVSGQDSWTLPAVPAIGLASLVMSDGPVGVRGTQWTSADPAVTLPSPTALAATWDTELAREVGRLLGQEARRKGVHLLLAPTVNLHRSPLGGRHFECYSEDPLLTAEIGAAYVAGVQDQGVGATVKHYVGNDSETDRFTVDVRVDERTLREMYLAPFETIVTRAGVWAVMAAYNTVNGTTMTEHTPLIRGVLKGEWAFDGVLVSDWTATRSVVETVLGGLDVAMPAMRSPWAGDALVKAVRAGEIEEAMLDEQVRRVLRLAARVGALSGVPPAVAPDDRPAPLDGAAVARTVAARSFVLARNEGAVLPLDPARIRQVALVGAAARQARILGGGSAQVFPAQVVSPLSGLAAALGPAGVELVYAVGADPQTSLTPAEGPQWTAADGASGVTATFRGHDGAVLHTVTLPQATARWAADLPPEVAGARLASVELAGRFTPDVGGAHRLGVRGIGQYTLTVGGRTVFDRSVTPEGADAFLHAPDHQVLVELAAGEPVEVVLRHPVSASADPLVVAFGLGHGEPQATPDELLDEAAAAAAAADVAVVVVATTKEVESEGFDRTTLALPGRQDELVARVAAANPRTVVVVNTGSPVLMPWAADVAAILLTWFPGEQAGAALAEVLLGAAEPGGRLPTTWPRRESDCPVLEVVPTEGTLAYDEGVFIGYRGWQRSGVEPLFPFGHGLGYTTWDYESIEVADGIAVVRVSNSGARAGREVVQVYVAPLDPARPAQPDRPARVLAGFAVVRAEPGETVEVRVPLPERATQVWDSGTGSWRTVPGRYTVEAAHSLTDPRVTADLTV
jgi:beta-glucosidase